MAQDLASLTRVRVWLEFEVHPHLVCSQLNHAGVGFEQSRSVPSGEVDVGHHVGDVVAFCGEGEGVVATPINRLLRGECDCASYHAKGRVQRAGPSNDEHVLCNDTDGDEPVELGGSNLHASVVVHTDRRWFSRNMPSSIEEGEYLHDVVSTVACRAGVIRGRPKRL